jgi:cell fate regulator YaaT (PSP1 superfamily)
MIRRSKEQWLSLFQQQTESGLSAAEFCKQHELCDKYFSLRKKQLLVDNFIPVVVRPQKPKTVSTPEAKTGMQCRLGNCVLQFESLPDAAWVSQLIKALS